MAVGSRRHVVLRHELRASLIVFIAAWPTILLLQWTLAPLIAGWNPVAHAGALCAVMAPVLTIAVCPVLDRLLPGRSRPVASNDPPS